MGIITLLRKCNLLVVSSQAPVEQKKYFDSRCALFVSVILVDCAMPSAGMHTAPDIMKHKSKNEFM